MDKEKVLFLDTVHPVLQERLEVAGLDCVDGTSWSRQKVMENIASFQGVVIRSRITLDRELLSKAESMKFIARSGSGLENVDVAYAMSRGIKCLHAPEGNRDAVGEQALGMLLALFHNLIRADREVRTGQWNREKNRGIELGGKSVGIIGYGNTGSAFARRLSGFAVEILSYDKYRSGFGNDLVKQVDMETIFEKTDVLSFHVPLTQETNYLFNQDYLSRFQKSIYLINTSRGKVVKTADLVTGLEKGKVLGACLDVLEYEKPSLESLQQGNIPDPLRYLRESERVVLSPHIAGWTVESYEKLSLVLAEKINRIEVNQ